MLKGDFTSIRRQTGAFTKEKKEFALQPQTHRCTGKYHSVVNCIHTYRLVELTTSHLIRHIIIDPLCCVMSVSTTHITKRKPAKLRPKRQALAKVAVMHHSYVATMSAQKTSHQARRDQQPCHHASWTEPPPPPKHTTAKLPSINSNLVISQ